MRVMVKIMLFCGPLSHYSETVFLTCQSAARDKNNALDRIFTNIEYSQSLPSLHLTLLKLEPFCGILAPKCNEKSQDHQKKRICVFSEAIAAAFHRLIIDYAWGGLTLKPFLIWTQLFSSKHCMCCLMTRKYEIARMSDFDPIWMKTSLKILLDDRLKVINERQWQKHFQLRPNYTGCLLHYFFAFKTHISRW